MAQVGPTGQPPTTTRPQAAIEVVTSGDASLVSVSGLVDERFKGFGQLGAATTVVIDVSGITRMTSFGVRQWLRGMDALPKTISDLYLLGCPTFFVDQLNMVLNFGGAARALTVIAPYTCPSCGMESGETIDVLAEHASLAKGLLAEKECARCGGKLEFDETPESYFSFLTKYAATSICPPAAQLLTAHGRYTSSETTLERPSRIIKLVHGSVTYFRIIGTIGSMFRARPFLVGAEGEVVLDLADVDRFDRAGQNEWRRLLRSLAGQVPVVTLVDVGESFLAVAGDSLALARNIGVASLLVQYRCEDCDRISQESVSLVAADWPPKLDNRVCTICGGATHNEMPAAAFKLVQKASMTTPPASANVIEQRAELVSRALADATAAHPGENATTTAASDDAILGKYKIVRRLSTSGTAEVFLAKQVGIGGFEKPVVLKRIHRGVLDSDQAIERFLDEAKIAGRLSHPNVVQILDVGEDTEGLHVAMEYVNGTDLRTIVDRMQAINARMPLSDALFVVREVAQALDHAYWSTDMTGERLGIVHRDVSPHNIIVSYDGAVKVLDFGVALSADSDASLAAKLRYVAPEATNGQLDHRSNLFSLGVVLYVLCSGTTPFGGSDPKDVVKKIRAGRYRPLQEIAAVPDQLAALVTRMLSSNPDERPQRGHEVVVELKDLARRYALEGSSASLARLVAQLAPSDVTARLDSQQSADSPAKSRTRSGKNAQAPAGARPAASASPNVTSTPSIRAQSKGLLLLVVVIVALLLALVIHSAVT